MIPDPLSTLLDGAEFRVAVRFGIGALVVGAAVGWAWRRAGRPAPVPVGGLLLAGAAALAIRAPVRAPRVGDPDLSAELAVGLVWLALAGLLVDVTRWPRLVAAAAGAPGAWLVAYETGLVDLDWVLAAVAAGTLAGGVLTATAEQRPGWLGLGPPLLALSAVGVYFTVPDTEEAMVLLAVAGPLAVLGWPLRLISLGTGGSMAAAGVVCWTVAAGGHGRLSSVVGGLACFGLLVIEPVGRWAVSRRAGSPPVPGPPAVAVLAAHLGVVYVASRVVGLRRSLSEAVVLAAGLAVTGVASVAVTVLVARRRSDDRPRSPAAATASVDPPEEPGRARRPRSRGRPGPSPPRRLRRRWSTRRRPDRG